MSWFDAPARVSPHAAQAEPSARTERASDCTFAGEGEMSTEEDHDPPEGRRATRTCAGEARVALVGVAGAVVDLLVCGDIPDAGSGALARVNVLIARAVAEVVPHRVGIARAVDGDRGVGLVACAGVAIHPDIGAPRT